MCLLSEPLDAVPDFWSAAAVVGELRDREDERLEIPRDAKRARVDGLEPDVAECSTLSEPSLRLRRIPSGFRASPTWLAGCRWAQLTSCSEASRPFTEITCQTI